MIKDLTDQTKVFVRGTDLGRHVRKIWSYKNICPVVDLSYRGAAFAFNLMPEGENSFAVEVVRRSGEVAFNATGTGTRRLVATGLDLRAAHAVLLTEARQIMRKVDLYLAKSAASQKTVGKNFGAKTVGILTLPLGANIGGILQAYALTEVLRQLGHRPILINRRHPAIPGTAAPADVEPSPLVTGTYQNIGQPINQSFIGKRIIDVSRLFQSSEDLRQTVATNGFDAVVVGSDQIWRPKYARTLLQDFFLDFLPETDTSVRRISYAASFGAPNWEFTPEQTRSAAGLIRRFTAVSMREDSGVALCQKQFGVRAQHVLDPTLLLSAAHYTATFALAPRDPVGGRLLSYILDVDEEKLGILQAVAERLSLTAYTAYGTPSSAPKTLDGEKPDRRIESWLASFHEAEFVVTDSFHGAAFSILFNKPFIAYGNPERGMARFTSLLKMFGLEDRLVIKTDEVDLDRMLRPIDWTAVNERLDAWRDTSFAFLNDALTGPVKVPPGKHNKNLEDRVQGAAQQTVYPVIRNVSASSSSSAECDENALKILCTGCGVCVSESPGSLKMKWSSNGFLVPSSIDGKVPKQAKRVCPFNPEPEDTVRDEDALAKIFLPDTKYENPKAGRYEGAYIGYSRTFRDSSSSGGISTYVFDKALKRGDVGFIFVVQADDTGGFKYKLLKKGEEVSKISKTRYFPVTLADFFNTIDAIDGKVAVSGVACFVKAIRLKQYYHPEYREKIPLVVGIVCGGLKSRYYTDFLASSAGIKGIYHNPEYRVKDVESNALDYSFSAADENNVTHSVKMKRLGDMWGTGMFKAKACDFCTDVLTELSDISLGDAWLPEYKQDGRGNSIIITRSPLAEEIIRSGLMSEELVLEEVSITQIAQSQGGGFNHKHGGLSYRVWEAETFSDIPVPPVRNRLLQPMSPVESVVQFYRSRTRSKSLLYWSGTRQAEAFNKRMKPALKGLKLALQSRRAGVSDGLVRWMFGESREVNACPLESKAVLRWINWKIRFDPFTLGLFRGTVKKIIGWSVTK